MTSEPTVARAYPADKSAPRPGDRDRARGRRDRARAVGIHAVGLGAALLLLAAGAGPLRAQAPDETWRAFETEHFHVTYPAELEETAFRAAERAERAYTALSERFIAPAPEDIDLVITDHTDVSNGFAALFPSKRITIFARPPLDGFALQYFDEWLELVVTHELVHTFHLDQSNKAGRIIRTVFGRVPSTWPLFPQAALPAWAIEGLATYYESELTQAGRVRGTYHDMVLRTAALEGSFESLDQALGDSPVWPLGDRAYVYGSRMLAHMAEQSGDSAVAAFVESVRKQWVPFRINSAAKSAFGRSFSEAWPEFREEVGRLDELGPGSGPDGSTTPAGSPRVDRTTFEPVGEGGYLELHPQPGPGGAVVYAVSDGRSETHLRVVDRRASRSLIRTNGIAVPAWLPNGGLLFHQREFLDPYRLRNDLYRWDPDGTVTRLTEGARLSHPTVDAEGRLAVAVQDTPGSNRLVEVDLATRRIRHLAAATESGGGEALFAFPALSPDGRWIAVTRWLPGARYAIVLLDRDGRLVTEVAESRAVHQYPAWSPDSRTLLFASDRTGIQNLYAVSVDPESGETGPRRLVTHVLTGVNQPAVDPEGQWIYASVYHANGWRIERMPYEPASWTPLPGLAPRFLEATTPPTPPQNPQAPSAGPYSPWRSLRPYYWLPLLGSGDSFLGQRVMGPWFGLQTSGRDVVGRHSYGASLLFEPEGPRTEGTLSYEFSGLGVPRIGVTAFQDHDAAGFVFPNADSVNTPVLRLTRERGVLGSVSFDRPRVRTFSQVVFTGGFIQETRQLLDSLLAPSTDFDLRDPDSPLLEAGVRLGFSNTQRFAFSVSPEAGVSVSVLARIRREMGLPDSLRSVTGADDGFRDLRGSARTYVAFPLWGFSRHALAFRASGGVAGGSGADFDHFRVGGVAGQSRGIAGGIRFGGSGLLFPVRGHSRDTRFGTYSWSASAEYRFPVALIHRGLGTFPLYFDRMWGSLFADAGNAWGGPSTEAGGFDNSRRSTLASVGGELSVTLVPFWTTRLQARLGVGVPVSGGGGAQVYLALGNIF